MVEDKSYPYRGFWVCKDCDFRSEEIAFAQYHGHDPEWDGYKPDGPADQGWRAACKHVEETSHTIAGLYDGDSQLIAEGKNRGAIVAQGLIPKKGETVSSRSQGVTSPQKSSPAEYVRLVPQSTDVPISGITLDIFYKVKPFFPERYPDDSPETLGLFIADLALRHWEDYGEFYGAPYEVIEQMRAVHSIGLPVGEAESLGY